LITGGDWNAVLSSSKTPKAGSWLDFWNSEPPIYACDRHKEQHYALVARDLSPFVAERASVLDHGCGDALSADSLAQKCETLYLFDAAPAVRWRLAGRFSAHPAIKVLSEGELSALPDGALDLVVANSLLQYLAPAEFFALLELWRRLLKSDGKILLADVPSPDVDLLSDAFALLSFARRGGFFLPALGGLARTFFSNYRHCRRKFGFAAYSAASLEKVLHGHGFALASLPRNIGHNQWRMSFIATKLKQA
jgi:SAM-dependent methyltransferase